MVSGRKPKPVHRHSVKSGFDWVEVPDIPFAGGPELPSGRKWSETTLAWWADVSTMPHCILWKRSDWRFALDTAILAAAFHAGDLKQAVELRRREAVMGTTPGARLGLRIKYVAPVAEEEPRSVTAIADYKKRLRR